MTALKIAFVIAGEKFLLWMYFPLFARIKIPLLTEQNAPKDSL